MIMQIIRSFFTMNWIVNQLLGVVSVIWTLWVCAFSRADMNAPYARWFIKCMEAKEKCGGICWNEWLAYMNPL